MFEHRSQKPIPIRHFAHRLLRSFAVAMVITGFSLVVGILGYHYLVGLDWIDALLDASMILGGMGPVSTIATTSGKLFASFFALYSGIVLIATMGVMLAPLVHRILHTFHAQTEQDEEKEEKGKTKKGKAAK